MPYIKKDGDLNEGTGIGPIKQYKPVIGGVIGRPVRPVDFPKAIERGILPEQGLSFDTQDPLGVPAMGYRKFTPERKQVFLEKLAETGRFGIACMHAGVVPRTVQDHKQADPDFAEQCKLAHELYHEITVALITDQARAGAVEQRFDKDGKVVYQRTSYETQLRLAMLKRGDASYQDTSRQEIAVVGGAVVVPAPTDSVESWDDVVKRHTGQLPAAAGERALAEGRVIKRSIDVQGESSDESEQSSGSELGTRRPTENGL